jgi:hypothetical protein
MKIIRPDAPWLKEDIDEFEDLIEADVPKKREEIADKVLISAVKICCELQRASDL